MKAKFIFFFSFIVLAFLSLILPKFTFAQVDQSSSPPPDIKQTFAKGVVISLSNGSQKTFENNISYVLQMAKVKITEGVENGKVVQITYDPQNIPDLKLHLGDQVIVTREVQNGKQVNYYINDKYRLPYLEIAIIAFLILAVLVVGKKGLGGLIGFLFSIFIIFIYIVPQILKGADPLTICFIGSIIILFISTYIAHGISYKTTIAVISTLISLSLTYFISKFLVNSAIVTGYGNSDAADLRFSTSTVIDLKSLLLGGIMIGTLGALNDITTTQAATIKEIFDLHKEITFKHLFIKSLNVGREHAVSIINTIILAYAGVSLAVFIFFMYNPQHWPYWVILNSENVAEELIKTLAGTFGLLLAVPLVTLLGSLFYAKDVREGMKKVVYKLR